MAGSKRKYSQYCGLARALDVIGERWTLLIVRDLLLGPKRYSDLLAGLPGLTTNLLARRLGDLERYGLVEKYRCPPPTPATVYRLSPPGLALEPLILETMEWGDRFMLHPEGDDRTNIGWLLLRLKSRYQGPHHFIFEFEADGRVFHMIARQQSLTIAEGEHPESELRISGSTLAIQRMLFGPEEASSFPNQGEVKVEGKPGRWPWLLSAFDLE